MLYMHLYAIYMIFGTNLLTRGPSHWCFIAYFSVSKKRNIKRSPNGMKPPGKLFLERKQSRRLGVDTREASTWPRGREARLPLGPPPPSWAPRCSTDVLLPSIYTYVPPNDQRRSQNPNSTAVTFCIHEIPSWGLFRSSAGGGIDYGGLLHQHHSPSDEVWVVHLRPMGP